MPQLRVHYFQLTQAPHPTPRPDGLERIALERLAVGEYLALYTRIGAPLGWDQRLRMARAKLGELLRSSRLRIYVLRSDSGEALGLCEFERGAAAAGATARAETALREVELKNFGLVPEAQGRRLGPWLLATALHREWRLRPERIWLHTDEWDHPAAIPVYQRAGFQCYLTRDEASDPL